MSDTHSEVFVEPSGGDVRAGELWSHRRRNVESATFAYDRAYLATPGAYQLDPALPLVDGPLQTPGQRKLFGAFTDCAPDRWGRRLIERAERRGAERDERQERSLGEIDYLLGGRDDMRQGALRFRDPESGIFLADEQTGVPSLVDLPKLLASSERLERDDGNDEDLRLLLRGGSSLGGARPKAHVIDADGNPALAKFPSPKTDDRDVMRWEAVAIELAQAAGIRVPITELVEVDGRAVLVVRRFDRGSASRIGYVSAMTMLGVSDGETRSYLEIAEAIEATGANPKLDLVELWRRVAFSILISNTDDHLRNHGFLRLSTSGWSLSPAFDLNPEPELGPKHLSTAIDLSGTDARIDTLIEVAPYFGVRNDAAVEIFRELFEATSRWREVAATNGLGRAEIEGMAPAFEHDQRRVAAELIA